MAGNSTFVVPDRVAQLGAGRGDMQSVPYATVVNVYQRVQAALKNALQRKGDSRNNAMTMSSVDQVADGLRRGAFEVEMSALDTISFKDKLSIVGELGLPVDRVEITEQVKTGGAIKSILSIPVDLLGLIVGREDAATTAGGQQHQQQARPGGSWWKGPLVMLVLAILIIYCVRWAFVTPFDENVAWAYANVPGLQRLAGRFASYFHAEKLINQTKPPPPPPPPPQAPSPPPPPTVKPPERFAGESELFEGLDSLKKGPRNTA